MIDPLIELLSVLPLVALLVVVVYLFQRQSQRNEEIREQHRYEESLAREKREKESFFQLTEMIAGSLKAIKDVLGDFCETSSSNFTTLEGIIETHFSEKTAEHEQAEKMLIEIKEILDYLKSEANVQCPRAFQVLQEIKTLLEKQCSS